MTDLTSLPARLDDGALAMVEEVARSSLPVLPPCDETHFVRCYRLMLTLPRKADDELTGTARLNLYTRMLGSYPTEAINHLAEQAIASCDWFPTPKQCLDILAGWKRTDDPAQIKAKAGILARRERQARADDMLAALDRREMTQAEIDALPLRIKRIAAERCTLWAWPDGRFTVRKDWRAMTEAEAEADRREVAAMMAEWEMVA